MFRKRLREWQEQKRIEVAGTRTVKLSRLCRLLIAAGIVDIQTIRTKSLLIENLYGAIDLELCGGSADVTIHWNPNEGFVIEIIAYLEQKTEGYTYKCHKTNEAVGAVAEGILAVETRLRQ